MEKTTESVALEQEIIERIVNKPLRQRIEAKLYVDFMNELGENSIAYLYSLASEEAREKAMNILEESVKEKWPEVIK